MELKNDTESITVYRSLNAEEQLWRFKSRHDNHPYKILFGGVVLEFLNALRNILNESEEQSPLDMETVGFLKHNSRYWEGRYYELVDSILAKKSLELTNLYMLYEKYKGFALEITDYQYIVASDGTSNEYRKNIETEITFKGYEILKNKQKYEVFTMPNGAYLFSLDLWNIFFQENMELQFKCCAYCNDFIKIKHRNQKYCSVCKEIVNGKNKKKVMKNKLRML